MTVGYVDAGVAFFYPPKAVTVDVSSADFDCTTHFPMGFATQIYVGSNAGNVEVLHAGDSTPVTYLLVPVGTVLKGAFAKILHASTTSTGLIALGM